MSLHAEVMIASDWKHPSKMYRQEGVTCTADSENGPLVLIGNWSKGKESLDDGFKEWVEMMYYFIHQTLIRKERDIAVWI